MANERAIICGDAPVGNLPVSDEKLVRLALWGKDANVHLNIENLTWPLLDRVPTAFMDLIEIAAYVYCGDQAVTRGGPDVERLGANWRRRLFYRIPVRHPERWSSPTLRSALVSTLSFLSDDDYEFEFTRLGTPTGGSGFLFKTQHDIQEVVLFSGGLDSFSGAVEEAVVGGRRVAFVRHRPTSKLETRQRRLRELLHAKCAHEPFHITVSINKEEVLGRGYEQRARSFLYVALGATVAHMLGRERVRFYENGVVSLNLPISAQVVGAKATRTTHPRVLRGFAEILTAVAEKPFAVENPYLWTTKSEAVASVIAAGCGELVKYTTSCTHTWETTTYNPHCGACSQCIDRRFAVLAARADEEAQSYGIDLITGERKKHEHRTMLASYVETARRVTQMDPTQFAEAFGEASRVLRHVGLEPRLAQQKVYDLYQRHAQQVYGVVSSALRDNVDAVINRTLPPTCLLRLLSDSTVESVTEAAAGAVCCVAHMRGERRELTRQQYEKLVQERATYALFIDGVAAGRDRPTGKKKTKSTHLSAWEAGILADLILAGQALVPHDTPTGRKCASKKAARRLFEEARKKVDVSLARYRFRAFNVVRVRDARENQKCEFTLAPEFSYCLLMPS